MTQTLNASRIGSITLDLHRFSAGVYFLKLTASGFTASQRLVIEK